MLTSGEDYFARHLARVPAFRALIRGLENQLFSQEALQGPVLDVGCGDGHFAAVAFPDGLDAGIDLTWDIVAEGRANGRYGHVEVADGTRLPYPSAAFRTVVSNCVIEHVPDIEGLVGEVARVLAPGGRFLFSVPNDSFTGALFTASCLERLGLHRQAEMFGRWWNRRAGSLSPGAGSRLARTAGPLRPDRQPARLLHVSNGHACFRAGSLLFCPFARVASRDRTLVSSSPKRQAFTGLPMAAALCRGASAGMGHKHLLRVAQGALSRPMPCGCAGLDGPQAPARHA